MLEEFVKKACRYCLRKGAMRELREYIALLPPPSQLAFFRRCDKMHISEALLCFSVERLLISDHKYK